MIALLITYRYLILLPLAIIEGPILAILVGFFIRLGYLSLIPSYLILIAGDFIPDSMYYYIGRTSSRSAIIEKYKSKISFLSKNGARMEKLWHTHTLKIMFFTKLAYGLSIPLLIISGNVKLPYKKFAVSAGIVAIVQYSIFLIIGYYFGHSYKLMGTYVKDTGITIAIAGVAVVVVYMLIKRYAQKEILKEENQTSI